MSESFVNSSIPPIQALSSPYLSPLVGASSGTESVGTEMLLQLADGSIQACSAGAGPLLGLSAEQIQSDIFQNQGWQIVQEDGSLAPCEVHPAMVALQTGKACVNVAMAFVQPNGNVIRLTLSAAPLFQTGLFQSNLLPPERPQPGGKQENIQDHRLIPLTPPYAVITTLTPVVSQGASFNSASDSALMPGRTAGTIDGFAVPQRQTLPVVHPASPAPSPSGQLFATLESISDAFFSLDRDWRFTYVNSQACHVLNRSADELLGKVFWEEFPDTIGTVTEDVYRRAVAEDATISYEVFYPPLNGWFAARVYPIHTEGNAGGPPCGLAVYFQNITEQKLAQAAFLQQEQTAQRRLAEIEAIYATAPVGLCFNDTELRYVRINQQLAEINGASVEQHIGRTLRELLPELADQLEPIYRQVIETGEPMINLEVSGTNPAQPGVLRTWLSSYYPLKGNDDRVLGVNVVVQEITEHKRFEAERKQAEAALIQSEERYRTLFESIDEGFCIIEVLFDESDTPVDYRFLETNPTFEAQTGLKEAIGKTVRELIPGIEESWIETYGRIALTGESMRFEDNSKVMNRWFDVYAFRVGQPEDRKVALLFKDVTERKRSEVALQESETRFRRMTDVLPQIIWTAEPDGTIDYYNQHWEDFTGASRIGTSDWEWRGIIHPEDVAKTIEVWTQAVRTEVSLYELEHRVRRKDGEYRWHITRAVPYRNEQGQIMKWFGFATDIHEQKLAMAERELYAEHSKRLLQREQAARAEAEAANHVKDEFLAVLSHELRSPLNPILGWTKLLQSGRLDAAKTVEALAAIERNAKLQTRLIEDLLDISRVMRGKLTLNCQPTSLIPVITAAAETVRLAAEAKAIQIELSLDPQVQMVSGDPERLQQVFWNLLSNAVKFTPSEGRVEVRLEQVGGGVDGWMGGGVDEQEGEQVSERVGKSNRQARAALNEAASTPQPPNPSTPQPLHSSTPPPLHPFAQLTITDTGKGIHPDFLPHVFDYFRQEDGSITRQFGGLGLGLAIARQIVEMHGGTIAASSAGEGQGAAFTVRLPLLRSRGVGEQGSRGAFEILETPGNPSSTHPPTHPPIYSSTPPSPHPLTKLRLLVVDDDPDTRELLTFLLDANGAIVTSASSAAEALLALKRDVPDVLLSDIGMPDQDGYTLLRLIRAAFPNQPIPAIAITAYAADYDREKALQVGFQQHLTKPIDPNAVIQTILNLTNPPPPSS